MGNRIYEVPISYAGREYYEGKKISWRDGFVVLASAPARSFPRLSAALAPYAPRHPLTTAPRSSGSPNQGPASPPVNGWRVSRADLVGLVALIALDLAAYAQLLDPGRMLADYDAYVYFYPLRAYAAAAIQAGRLPLWNPSSFLGVPFLANPQTALSTREPGCFSGYRCRWPTASTWSCTSAWPVFFSTPSLASASRRSPPAAFVGAAAFMLGGVLAGQYGHLESVQRGRLGPPRPAGGRPSLDLSQPPLGRGHGCTGRRSAPGRSPSAELHDAPGAGVVTLGRALREPRPLSAALRAIGLTALAGLLGAGLAGLQLLPTAELAAASVRGAGLMSYRDAIAGSLWPWLVARALLPATSTISAALNISPTSASPRWRWRCWRSASRRWRRMAPSLALVGLGLLLALGGANPLYPALYAAVPGVASFRVPARWLLLYSLGICSLASLGLDWLLAQARLALRAPGHLAPARDP